MIKRYDRTFQQEVQLHLDSPYPVVVFEGTVQDCRIKRARQLIEYALNGKENGVIVELCSGAADISGHFSDKHTVTGIDCVWQARDKAIEKWPKIHYWLAPVELIKPQPCDVIVLCETLEHITNPIGLVSEWLPLARYAIISHPLCPPERDPEFGHMWSYNDADFWNWFKLGGHRILVDERFSMGCYDKMAIGLGVRKDICR